MKKSEIGADVLGLVVTLVCVWLFKWQASDIIWGLWICSLLTGYTFIVVAIFGGIGRSEGAAKMLHLAGGLFMLAFFSVHFGMFHFVHAMFLNVFFPIIDIKGFPSPWQLLGATISQYWALILATFISRFSDMPWGGMNLSEEKGAGLMKPYANVIRMHLLIFVFAGLHAAKLSNLAIYPVLAFYFFPWGKLLGKMKKGRKTTGDGQQRTEPR